MMLRPPCRRIGDGNRQIATATDDRERTVIWQKGLNILAQDAALPARGELPLSAVAILRG